MLGRRLLLGATPLTALPAAAQDFPSRPINIIVGFPPGGQADLAARPVAPALEKILRQPVDRKSVV